MKDKIILYLGGGAMCGIFGGGVMTALIDYEKLKKTYEMGKRAAKKIIKFAK